MAENRHEGTEYRAGCPGAADLPGFTDRNYWQRKAAEMATYGHEGGHAFNEDQRAAMREVEDGGGHDGLAPSADERRAERQRVIRETQAMGERAAAARPFVAAFPVADGHLTGPGQGGMSLSEYYAGEAIRALVGIYPVPGTNEDYRGEYALARWAHQIGEAMEVEALRRRGGA
jgi:hypothetical protein